MSGGGGSSYGGRRWVHEVDATAMGRVDQSSYEAEASDYLRGLLRAFNDRDVAKIREYIAEIAGCIGSDLDGTVDLEFGGSVRKHTYVDGLSDVDALLIVNRMSLAGASPRQVLNFLRRQLASALPHAEVTVGALAVTVTYRDGVQVQVLPAIKTATGVRISDSRGHWSSVVRPNRFAAKLTAVNKANGGQVVPTIKLFKGLQQALPSTQRLSGYHIESLAIEAFRSYVGPKTPKAMLCHLVREAASRVGRPIQDQTGQSRHVDNYLGRAGSTERSRVGAALRRLSERLGGADRTRSVDRLRALFGD